MSVVHSAKSAAKKSARRVLGALRIEPAFVRALVKPPGDVHGGPTTRRWPWPRRRHIGAEERAAAMRVFDREIREGNAVIYNGPEQKAYQEAFTRYLGGEGYATAVNSGTNAIYIALRALELPPGSEVIVSAVTNTGCTMPVALLNCIPIPADSAPGLLNTSADEIRKVLSPRTAAILVAHIAGRPVDMDPILALAEERGIPVVEDCAQALGAVYKGRMVGTLGTAAAFSTMFLKQHCTGGQGGVVFTKSTLLNARIRQIADRGKPFGALGDPENLVASLNFNQDEIGMAIGRAQLAKMPGNVERRRAFVAAVIAGMAKVDGIRVVTPQEGVLDSPCFLQFHLDPAQIGCDPQQFAHALEREGIGNVMAGYPFTPTAQPWHDDAVVYGRSGMPWSLSGDPERARPRTFALPNARKTNTTLVRVDVHEFLGATEARDLTQALAKLARHFRRVGVSAEATVPVAAAQPTEAPAAARNATAAPSPRAPARPASG
jgi:dTDP-4-amino-4,6-dideoxygalactose transaminase